VTRLGKSASKYHKALLLDYPNADDRAESREPGATATCGWSKNRRVIEIHGEGGRNQDWTDGCVALANGDMDLVFELRAWARPSRSWGATSMEPSPSSPTGSAPPETAS